MFESFFFKVFNFILGPLLWYWHIPVEKKMKKKKLPLRIYFLSIYVYSLAYSHNYIISYFGSIQQYYQRLVATPLMAKFLKSPFRKRKNDEQYIKEVKRVLNRE